MNEPTPAPPPCPLCNGCGQISSFKGVSRFLLTTEECPACGGTGLDLDDEEQVGESRQPGSSREK
ncbi:hypothetical protein JWG42_05735 [Desulfoprunum benzoelyticum]|uniref:DnaJ-class molecular chaperone n=1 Tax=Desulfoprunum benzoelyticum TaxID=1506996 RepID=A0A840US29_9BACT|nr:hypothetical protein [Desulfoprunum benzoelyticum]MBB5347473.1 DnaJ-class molecular chaperone [Desulfoprunum benzoelyticum]MBM9529649.1 hypothetical protein [Desulfoprunum benzoelyticum]